MKKPGSRQLSIFFLVLSLVLGALGGYASVDYSSPKRAASLMERMLKTKSADLDRHAEAFLHAPNDVWPEGGKLSRNFVLYKYVNDTLIFWKNTFPVMNDDISAVANYQRFVRQQNFQRSPLVDAKDHYEFMMLENKPYLVKRFQENSSEVVIAGLDLQRVAGSQQVSPVFTGKGERVVFDGIPQFCLARPSGNGRGPLDTALVILCVLSFLVAMFLWLRGNPTLPRGFLAVAFTVLLSFTLGRRSPASLSDPIIWHAIIANCAVFVTALILNTVRSKFKRNAFTFILFITAAIACVVRAGYQIHAIYNNTRVSLELYRIEILSVASIMVIVSLVLLMLSALIFLHLLSSKEKLPVGRRIAFSLASALLLVFLPAVGGFFTESKMLKNVAAALAVERDMSLERRLRMAESRIASDPVMAMALDLEAPEAFILNRITSVYLPTVGEDYTVSVNVGIRQNVDGEQIATGSRFYYTPSVGGHCRYTGTFLYYGEYTGVSMVTLTLEPVVRSGHTANAASPRTVFVPSRYSYAKYEDGVRQFYRGSFVYPIQLYKSMAGRHDGYRHFEIEVAPQTVVVMSRPAFSAFVLVVAVLLLALLQMGLLALVYLNPGNFGCHENNYFRKRISALTTISLVLTLAMLAVVSVLFVYNRNDENTRLMMVEKISSARAMIQSALDMVDDLEDVSRRDLFSLLRSVSDDVNSDLSLYRADGRLFMSAAWQRNTPFSVQPRMSEEAYRKIVWEYESYAIEFQEDERRGRYLLYAPILSSTGMVMAVLVAPYQGGDMDFEYEAVIHLASIITVFLILLILASFFATRIVNRLFAPLTAMGARMKSTDLNSLERIEYDRNDEISSLVDSYNRMVQELEDSSVKLAQAERDKAWSEMARQVAHEIKNPLTPMKLQIQRVQRLRQNGDPKWEGRFDEMSKVLLDHIDVLADTANEFSTFAKLYSEAPVDIELDALLKEEMALFSEASGLEYIGLENVHVSGPKPQLTRVIVNLLGNAVQAVEEVEKPRIVVSLRNGVKDGFYEIVVEDNGPGVGEENIERLFTPNFTTKSSGSGLGLAISRSILERCGASISYSKSILLGGACFTILYPKG